MFECCDATAVCVLTWLVVCTVAPAFGAESAADRARRNAVDFVRLRAERSSEGDPLNRLFAGWREATIGKPTPYYRSTGELAYLCYPVLAGHGDDGYVIVSVEDGEIAEFSIDLPPHRRNRKALMAKAAEEMGAEAEPRYVFVAPGRYLAEFRSADRRDVYDLRTLERTKVPA